MTEDEREELIEKITQNIVVACGYRMTPTRWLIVQSHARAALAVAEPLIREECARIAENFGNDVSASKYESSFSGKCVISASLDIAAAIREGGNRDE